jgi:hypothetical protein
MLRISQRVCKLGDKYAGKKDPEGEALSLKVRLEEITLDREELNAFCDDPHAWTRYFDTSNNPPKPVEDRFKPRELKKPWEGAYVVLWYEFGKSKVEFKNAKLSNITIEPRLGGDTFLSCTVEGEPALDRKFTDIIARIGGSIECEIHADRPEDQKELPINAHGEDEQPAPRKGKRNGHHPSAQS